MKTRPFVLTELCCLLLLVSSSIAQFSPGEMVRRVRVQVDFASGVCDAGARVALIGRVGAVAESATNDQCQVDFLGVPEGTYHLSVSGGNVTNADAGVVTVTAAGSTDFEVKVKNERLHDASGNDASGMAPALSIVSATDLAVPSAARREFDKANDLIAHKDFKQAIEKLNNAIAAYPAYAAAYNNLGVVYARMGERAHEAEALQKAIGINSHFAPAFVNLGRMNISAGNFADAETDLNKASAFDPTDAMTLVLLAYSEFMDQHFDEAVASSQKAHTLGGTHAYAHQIAARVFEHKRDAVNAIAELELFLKEEDTGPRAESARKELAHLEDATHALAAKSPSQ